MEPAAILVISIIAFLISLAISHEIVRSAVSSALKKQNQQQLEFL